MMDLHFEKIDKAFSPGLTVVHWVSINLDAFIAAVNSSLKELDILVTRLNDTGEQRIFQTCAEIERIKLIYLPETSLSVSEFNAKTCELCEVAGSNIETKSESVEKAVEELIDLLVGPEVILGTFQEEEGAGALSVKKRMEQRTKLMQEAEILRSCCEQVLLDSQLKLLKNTLERIRKRLAVKTAYEDTYKPKLDNPLFESDLILALPNILMKPSMDEIQQLLNSTVSTIISTTKRVSRWGQPRHVVPHPPTQESVAPPTLHCRRSRVVVAINDHSTGIVVKTFYEAIKSNKELQKLIHALGAAVNSTKRVILATVDRFNYYSHLWETDRKERMQEFMEVENPGVNEFRVEMSEYAKLGEVIDAEPDVMVAGTISLNTEKLKLALMTEMRAWIVSYGRTMNCKYQSVMEEVFKSIADWTKRLNRPLSDLEDIRSIMGTLKEVRENEIQIDMSLDPIEVS